MSATLQTAQSITRLVEGWTPRQVWQHRQAFELALHALDAFLSSPQGQGMHADALRFWNYQRGLFHQSAHQLAAIAGDHDFENPLLLPIKKLIEAKSHAEIMAIREDIRNHIRSITQVDPSFTPSPSAATMEQLAIDRARLVRHRLELAYLNHVIDQD